VVHGNKNIKRNGFQPSIRPKPKKKPSPFKSQIHVCCKATSADSKIFQKKRGMMGTKVGLALKILYKFQMGQLQDQEPRRSRKQCKDWCNPLGMKLARAQQSKWV
jgi:hypothetical protein